MSHLFRGGTGEAKRILEDFIKNRFGTYVEHRNQPQTDDVSHMSKYLHYGHVSPVYVALEIRRGGKGRENIDSYIEELIMRRELSMNFCHYAPEYDSFSCLGKGDPQGARQGRARVHLCPRAARGCQDARRLLERGDEGDASHRLHAQLHEDVLGEEDPGVQPYSRGGLRDDALPEQQVLRDATRTPARTSHGSSASTAGAGGSGRSLARCATRHGQPEAQGEAQRVRQEGRTPHRGRQCRGVVVEGRTATHGARGRYNRGRCRRKEKVQP